MRKNYIYAFLTVAVWSTTAAISKLLLLDIPTFETLAVSGFLAFLFLLILNIKNKTAKKLREYSFKDYCIMSGLGFLGLFLYTALYYFGLNELSSQEACILNYLWPIMIVIFSSVLLKEKITVLKAFAMLSSFFGIIILSTGSGPSLSGNSFFGIISCIAAAACYGLFSVLNKKFDYDQNIAMMIFWLITAVFSAVAGVFTEEWVCITGMQWFGFLWLGIVINAIAYLLWAIALKGSADTSKIANLAYLVPFLSLVVSAILLNEPIRFRSFIALIFIIDGILIGNLYEYLKKNK
jgi:drug/metabolite transporter (DMT)-like permease